MQVATIGYLWKQSMHSLSFNHVYDVNSTSQEIICLSVGSMSIDASPAPQMKGPPVLTPTVIVFHGDEGNKLFDTSRKMMKDVDLHSSRKALYCLMSSYMSYHVVYACDKFTMSLSMWKKTYIMDTLPFLLGSGITS
jgi:hypothetical protein